VVEGTGLENRHTCKGIESSNLSLSVTMKIKKKGPRNSRALFFIRKRKLLIEDVDPAWFHIEPYDLAQRHAACGECLDDCVESPNCFAHFTDGSGVFRDCSLDRRFVPRVFDFRNAHEVNIVNAD
jgi:hypothetical protein